MSYLVLARKWRPRRFSELVGQEHVVRALSNALETGRVHHAFLFTGTRGVGKTTIARIFAKSLNCARGVGAEPCGECEVCVAVDEGRFVDLLEIDAASNTGVDDVREVIENAQYLPTRGRYKVYLIDEVHMLSKNAFNALLKTLEEPPEHVKFLLATTDPQKLLPTVLSRCLQFHLRRLSEEQIAGQIRHILTAEGVAAEEGAIAQLAHAADGSLRDGLSLLDQALAFTGGGLTDAAVRAMLGTVDRSRIAGLLDALAEADGTRLMQVAADVAGFSPDFGAVLDALAHALHRVQIRQLVPGVEAEAEGVDVAALAARLSPEIVQLWYQMAVNGRRDIDFAPSPQVGFEMSLLRMLAFQPMGDAEEGATPARPYAPAQVPAAPARTAPRVQESPIPAPPPSQAAAPPPAPAAAAPSVSRAAAAQPVTDNDSWLAALQACGISGPARELGANLQFVGADDGRIRVHLPASVDYLKSPVTLGQLSEALGQVLGTAPRLEFVAKAGSAPVETLADRRRSRNHALEASAREEFSAHPLVRDLVGEGGKVREESIRPRAPGG
ncbi:MAG: DNA polymerase III subunit gamma/tau [Chiayiivirga sp.]|jgi:DNA polymerase-3 subunit gamma/tau|uniref:DNA polymerase III subunit gamma/tau n=1 Tax=Denitratimonas tolerans TaxID=1338420 RepID=A0AAW9R976_9GAMM|nr:DNA polymerase III subunit gamma/tau [Chiayiivirga sp.]HRO87571.1 DNA polymerase III subunit gamma/tau [Chiayiivirga sp.]